MFGMHSLRRSVPALILLLALLSSGVARSAEPVARAVLFYAPSCPHCHIVLEQVLPPLQAHYGEQLAIQIIDVSHPEGQALYQATIAAFGLPAERIGVPTLVFGTTVLVGSAEIPAQLPGLIAGALAVGGNAWPAIPGLPSDAGPRPTAPPLSPFQRDPLANSIAVLVLLGMITVVAVLALRARPPFARPMLGRRKLAVLLLIVAGMAIAGYLALIEVSGTPAVCGPVGDCNSVQQSAYARLFGLLPIGVLGLLGYTALLIAWGLQQFTTGHAAAWAGRALPAIAAAGTLFSIYLTFLEPFVIGASCLWCLSSAVIMTSLLWLLVPHERAATQRGRPQRRPARSVASDSRHSVRH